MKPLVPSKKSQVTNRTLAFDKGRGATPGGKPQRFADNNMATGQTQYITGKVPQSSNPQNRGASRSKKA